VEANVAEGGQEAPLPPAAARCRGTGVGPAELADPPPKALARCCGGREGAPSARRFIGRWPAVGRSRATVSPLMAASDRGPTTFRATPSSTSALHTGLRRKVGTWPAPRETDEDVTG